MTQDEWTEFVHEHRAMIAVAEACWRKHELSYSFHVLDWMCAKLRWKYPLTPKYQIIKPDFST